MSTLNEIIKLVPYVIGGIVVAWYWNQRRHTLDRYRFLDDAYFKILQQYQETPQFGDPERTTSYKKSYKGDAALQYHYFAMTVHTVMESLFDQYEGDIPKEWLPVFNHHSALHAAWLWDNRDANRQEYIDRVLAGEPVAPVAASGGSAAETKERTRTRSPRKKRKTSRAAAKQSTP